jgi:hypothetical protein
LSKHNIMLIEEVERHLLATKGKRLSRHKKKTP